MSLLGFNVDLVDIAPCPVFARLERLNERMTTRSKMRRCVPSGRRVAASDVTACQAEPKMNPPAADLQTFLATACLGSNRLHLIQMGTLIRCVLLDPYPIVAHSPSSRASDIRIAELLQALICPVWKRGIVHTAARIVEKKNGVLPTSPNVRKPGTPPGLYRGEEKATSDKA